MARGGFSEAHVRRVFWRAGFGATEREATRWAKRGRAATLEWLLRPNGKPARLVPGSRLQLDPLNEYGHDVLWWLDRMVRTTRPLEEKMALFWHDHFATRDQDTPLMLRQNHLFRRGALGSFPKLLAGVLEDPAMGFFLNVIGSHKDEPNENFARELMELFTLGEGRGYSERDIREAARALTGYREGREVAGVVSGVWFDPEAHDPGVKTIFARRGAFRPRAALRLCLEHPQHARFLVGKLWSFFVDEPLDRATRLALQRRYVRSGGRIKPVVAAILDHPALYADLDRPGMVKAPLVLVAGLLRTTGVGLASDDWQWMLSGMGQRPFSPPSVAGWEWGPAWLDTSAMHARYLAANSLLDVPPVKVEEDSTPLDLTPEQHLERALAVTGRPWISDRTGRQLKTLATRYRAMADREWKVQTAADMTQRALRHLLLSGPDAQLH